MELETQNGMRMETIQSRSERYEKLTNFQVI